MYITILLTWFRVHYKISNNNTYTYSSDTKSGLYKKKKKKKKNLTQFVRASEKKISLNLKISHCFCPNGIFSLTKIWGQNYPCKWDPEESRLTFLNLYPRP